MKYLKLFEESADKKDDHFILQTDDGWYEIVQNIVSFDAANINRIPSELNPEIRKSLSSESLRDPLKPKTFDSYVTIKINKYTLFIYELPDEYYGLYLDLGYASKLKIRYKCDQIEGLLKCIEFVKEQLSLPIVQSTKNY